MTTTPPHGTPTPAPVGFFAWLRSLGIVRRDGGWAAGVAAGLAARWGIDVAIVRGILILLALFGGFGVLLYGLAWALLPDERGAIHLQEAIHGRWRAGFTGALIVTILGFSGGSVPVLGVFNGGLFGISLASIFALLLITLVIWLIVSAINGRSRPPYHDAGQQPGAGPFPGTGGGPQAPFTPGGPQAPFAPGAPPAAWNPNGTSWSAPPFPPAPPVPPVPGAAFAAPAPGTAATSSPQDAVATEVFAPAAPGTSPHTAAASPPRKDADVTTPHTEGAAAANGSEDTDPAEDIEFGIPGSEPTGHRDPAEDTSAVTEVLDTDAATAVLGTEADTEVLSAGIEIFDPEAETAVLDGERETEVLSTDAATAVLGTDADTEVFGAPATADTLPAQGEATSAFPTATIPGSEPTHAYTVAQDAVTVPHESLTAPGAAWAQTHLPTDNYAAHTAPNYATPAGAADPAAYGYGYAGGGGGYGGPGYVAPAPAPKRPRSRRATLITIGAALVVVGLLVLLDYLEPSLLGSNSTAVTLSLALVVVAIGIIVQGIRGRAAVFLSILGIFGVLSVSAAGMAAPTYSNFTGINWSTFEHHVDSFEEQIDPPQPQPVVPQAVFAPKTLEEATSEPELTADSVVLDLRQLDRDLPIYLPLEVHTANLSIVVPTGTTIKVLTAEASTSEGITAFGFPGTPTVLAEGGLLAGDGAPTYILKISGDAESISIAAQS